MRERIFLTYSNASALPYHGAVLGHHVVMNYVDANGKHFTLEGVPERGFNRNAEKLLAFLKEEYGSDGVRNTDSPFRRLRAKEGKVEESMAPTKPHTMIAAGHSLKSQWDRMKRFGDEVNATGYEYRPTSQNSNSFAAEALRRAGLLGPGTALPEAFSRLSVVDPENSSERYVGVPGFERRLAHPLNMAVPPLDAIPFLPPTESLTASRLAPIAERIEGLRPPTQGLRGEGIGRPGWLPPAESKGPSATKPERYLTRQPSGRSDASPFDTGAAPVPFIPNSEISDGDNSNQPISRFGRWTSSPPISAPRVSRSAAAGPDQAPGIAIGKPEPELPFRMPVWDFVKEPSKRDDRFDRFIRGLLLFNR